MQSRMLLAVVASIVGLAIPGSALSSDRPQCDEDNGGLELPDGFCALQIADDLGNARHVAVADNGDVYVAVRDRDDQVGGVAAMRDTTGDGRMNELMRFGENGGTGIAIRNNHLYFGEDRRIIRFTLHDKHLGPNGDAHVVASGFPQQSSHAAKSFVLDGDGNLYVNSGAPSNNCQEEDRRPGSPGLDPCPELERGGGIWKFDGNERGQQQVDVQHYATGIRHAVAMAWSPLDQQLYVVQHGRDQLSELWPEIYDDKTNARQPSEEFLRVTEGANFGWPYCYHDSERETRVLAPEYGGDGRGSAACNDRYPPPEMAFPAHYAPNDLLFYSGRQFPERYRYGAFVAFHGSWNRAPEEQRGYKVAFVPFGSNGRINSEREWEVFADGFAGTDTVLSPEDADRRPMGLAQGPDGSLYITDSQRGAVWRVLYVGESD